MEVLQEGLYLHASHSHIFQSFTQGVDVRQSILLLKVVINGVWTRLVRDSGDDDHPTQSFDPVRRGMLLRDDTSRADADASRGRVGRADSGSSNTLFCGLLWVANPRPIFFGTRAS